MLADVEQAGFAVEVVAGVEGAVVHIRITVGIGDPGDAVGRGLAVQPAVDDEHLARYALHAQPGPAGGDGKRQVDDEPGIVRHHEAFAGQERPARMCHLDTAHRYGPDGFDRRDGVAERTRGRASLRQRFGFPEAA